MPFAIVTTSNARIDIQQAIDWENERATGLGGRFLKYLSAKFDALAGTPFMGSVHYDDVRCTTTDVFQYLIHYIVIPDRKEVIILRVLHTSRKPIR
jgi:plasmid stabilization system protein ParE